MHSKLILNSYNTLTGFMIFQYKKGKVIPSQARCVPEVGWRYSSTLP